MAPNNTNTNNCSTMVQYVPQTYPFLSPETFETLVEGYINQLHIRKRNKALINQQLANDCLMVLTNPENTAIFNPKFRWWVRKHFVFTVVGDLRILMDKKNGKPVCVREQLYDKVCYFHHIIGHGGRDKTFAAITKSYSKVPAELVSLFTKNCQTCLGVRKYSKNKRPILNEYEYPQQQPLPHPTQLALPCSTNLFSPTQHQTQQHHAQHAQHQPQQQHQILHGLSSLKSEPGPISPISPMLSHSGSGFFSSNMGALTHHQQALQHHTQQQHNSMMGLNLADMSNLGLSAPSSVGAASATMLKMDLPMHPLIQHNGNHNAFDGQHGGHVTGLTTPSDLTDSPIHSQHQLHQPGQYSPPPSVHQTQYHPHAQPHDYTASFATPHTQHHHPQHLQSSYSAALSLTTFQQAPQLQYHQPTHHTSSSPTLTQSQLFQKQIQDEQQRFHQQSKFLPDSLVNTMSSAAPTAVPSMPTPTSATVPGMTLSSLLDHHTHADLTAAACEVDPSDCHPPSLDPTAHTGVNVVGLVGGSSTDI